MRLSRVCSALVAFLLVVPTLFAAEDLSGKWSGTFVISVNGGASRDDAAHMVLKHSGATLTGTAGPNESEQFPIAKGTVTVTKADGKEVTKASFEVQPPADSGPPLQFDLELVGGRLKGNAKAEMDGMTMSAVVDLGRLK